MDNKKEFYEIKTDSKIKFLPDVRYFNKNIYFYNSDIYENKIKEKLECRKKKLKTLLV